MSVGGSLKVAHSGKVAGRLLADADFRYAYPSKTAVELADALGAVARHDYDAMTGTYSVRDFSGRSTTTYYFMRYDVAYLGKVRKVVDGRDRDLVSFRYDKATGRPVRVTDQLGNKRVLEYDAKGNCTKLSRRADWSLSEEPVRAFAYDRQNRLVGVSELDADGNAVRTTKLAYDHFGRLVEKDENGLVYAYTYDAYGSRTSRMVSSADGETTEERRSYDKYGRLVEISSFGTLVKYRYDAKGRIARQTVDGSPIDFAYTKYGRLAGKYLGGREKPDAVVEYEYSKSGQIVARTANGVRQTYEYDGRGQLLAVKENGADVERYAYDKAGNMVKKALLRPGRAHTPGAPQYQITTFTFDGANQLVSSTTDGVTTKYAYDAAGRLVKEGNKTYRYGYLDKVLSVAEGAQTYTYDYHVDGQLARADYGNNGRARTPAAPQGVEPAGTEDFRWDGLALIKRGDERFVNEPHIGGGNPVASSKGTTYFNDILGTTVGAKKGRKYSAAALTAFGERMGDGCGDSPASRSIGEGWFTGKPEVAGLGHAFLFRNYRASLAKWQTADPLGYPDGWNRNCYCLNRAT